MGFARILQEELAFKFAHRGLTGVCICIEEIQCFLIGYSPENLVFVFWRAHDLLKQSVQLWELPSLCYKGDVVHVFLAFLMCVFALWVDGYGRFCFCRADVLVLH